MTLLGKPGIVNREKVGGGEPKFMLRAQDEFTESADKMHRARDKLVESIVEINRLLAIYHGRPVQRLNKYTFLTPARRGDKEE